MRQVTLLIKPASSICNMRCAYCFYEDETKNRSQSSMGIMTNDTIEAIVSKTMKLNVDAIHYCFQGGEPTMAGIDYFYTFTSCVKQMNNGKQVTYSIQTNGLVLNEDWFQLFKDFHFLVGVSLDGFIENHDALRKDVLKKGTYHRILKHIKRLDELEIEYNILTVLTHQLAKHPKELFAFYMKENLKYVQLIPCLPSIGADESLNEYALTPIDFFNFYQVFFDEWIQSYEKGKYLSVTLFDNLIPMYLGVPPQQCGMLGRCQMQLVIEGDGSVYPCDFYVLDEHYCGNINRDDILDILKHKNATNFITEKKELSEVCQSCDFYKMCYGNCKRMNVCYVDDHYCGYQAFLKYSQSKMIEIARRLR